MSRVVLVLGGGGMKGLTHVGAWRALQEAGVSVDEVIGTSIGGLVGAMIAAGAGAEALTARALAVQRTDIVALNRWAVLLNGIRQPAVFHDVPFREFIARVLPVGTFAELRTPFSVNAVDLASGEMVWFGAGGRQDVSLSDAVYASCALPLFFPPAAIGERLYVDGGVLETLALARAAERGATRIIAIDAGSEGIPSPASVVEQGMVGIHQRVFQLMATQWKRHRIDSWDGPPVTFVRPRLEGYGTFDFGSTAYFLEEGYRAMREALVAAGHVVAARGREA